MIKGVLFQGVLYTYITHFGVLCYTHIKHILVCYLTHTSVLKLDD